MEQKEEIIKGENGEEIRLVISNELIEIYVNGILIDKS